MTPSTSDIVAKAFDLLQTIQHGKRRHALEKGVDAFVGLLTTIPDCAPHELSDDSIALLFGVAEDVIRRIEGRVNLGGDSDAVQRDLVKSIYEIRRALEEIDRWRRHYAVALG